MALMYHPTSSHCIPSEITQCRATHNGANSFANMVLSAKNKEIASSLRSHTRSSLNLTKGWSFDVAEVKQRRGYQVIVAASPPTEDAVVASEPLTKEDLVGYLASGCKPKEKWRIGTGHEKFGFEIGTLRPMKYDQIAELLNGISERFDWDKIMEGEYIIGLKQGKQSISLEPGGQFELSGAPLETLHQTCAEVNSHLYQVKAVAKEMGIGFLGVGFQPKWKREDTPGMPKGRYAIMKNYMPKVGTLGLDMMFRTCTVQVNYHLLRSFTKFLHTQVSWSASCTEKKQLRSTIKAQAMELTKEAHSYREKDRIPKDPWHQADTAIDNQHALWPPENKADNPALNNPLLRQERMGCGWLGVIFEWEGVLVEENPDHEKQAWLTLALEEGKSPPPAFMLPRIDGMKNEQAIGEVLCWSRDPSELKRMSSRKEDIYNFLHSGDYKFRPGSQSFVNVLTNHKVPMALVSTRPRKSIERAIAVIGIENVFSVIVAAEDVHRGKPDPEMFSYAGQLLQFIPERCIVFGNSNLTVEAARDARMKCVAVASKHPVYELGAADIVVSRLDELSVVDLKNLADIESPEFGLDEPEMEMEVEEDDIDDRYSSSSSSGGFYDDFW